MIDTIEKGALAQLAQLLQAGGGEGDLRIGREFGKALVAEIAALTPPEGYVLVPVEERQDAKRFRWLKTCSKEQYLLARGVFGLAEDVIDAAIQSEEMEARNG
ncbi:hypothetical protein ACNPNN_13045 [Stenotrophomonas geniculata]|uniref:hypothetical protein n=1 Tax=Stenotrophomonas geniculata TaxID=86188 RepID=UPI003AAB33F5